jgi:predicted nucleotidyltransferase
VSTLCQKSGFQSRGDDATVRAVKTIQPGLLEEAVERLKTEFQPERIWLFGSHAWGTPTEDSDVDLMVIVPSSNERPIRRMQRAQRCLRGIGFAKDVLVNTRPEFDRYRHLKAFLSHKILERGRKLYG